MIQQPATLRAVDSFPEDKTVVFVGALVSRDVVAMDVVVAVRLPTVRTFAHGLFSKLIRNKGSSIFLTLRRKLRGWG